MRGWLRIPLRVPYVRTFLALAAFAVIWCASGSRAEASVVVRIDRPSQRMEVTVDGVPRYNWRVSTARRALDEGASVLVIGRPITAAADPAAAIQEIAASLSQKEEEARI